MLPHGRDGGDFPAHVRAAHLGPPALDDLRLRLGSLPVLIFSALGLVLSSVILVLKVRGSRARRAGEGGQSEQPPRRDSGTPEPSAS
jgi:hypothetical protein